jgi:hypothetical protein
MKNMDDIFESQSVVKTITLCMLTFGLYVIYRLFTLTKEVNGNVNNIIPTWFTFSAITIHLISFISLVTFFATANGTQELLIFSKAMHVLSSIFHVTWLIKVRNRINQISGVKKGSEFWLNPILSSFFHVIYIQYKINQFSHSPVDLDRTGENAIYK